MPLICQGSWQQNAWLSESSRHRIFVLVGGFGDASVRTVDLRGRQSEMDGEARQDMKDFVGHSGSVFGVDFAPDHPLLLSCSADSTIRLWHLDLGACLNSHKYSPRSSTFRVGLERYLAIEFCKTSQFTGIWGEFELLLKSFHVRLAEGLLGVQRQTMMCISLSQWWFCVYRGHNFPVWDVKFGPFGHYFASSGADKTCRIWSVERNSPLRVLAGVKFLSWIPMLCMNQIPISSH